MIKSICPQCNQPFTPCTEGPHYCSNACLVAVLKQRIADLRASVRVSLDAPSDEVPAKAKQEDERAEPDKDTSSTRTEAPSELQVASINAAANAYLASGQILEQRTQDRLRRTRTTLVLAGYGTSLRVERDALVVKEGHTHNDQTPSTHVIYRAMHTVERIVCIDCKGSVSFDALRWCAAQGIAVSLLDRHGSLVSELTPETDGDVFLRRQQYILPLEQTVSIAAKLVCLKIRAQAATLASHPRLPGVAAGRVTLRGFVQEAEDLLVRQPTLENLRLLEGRAAAAYFAAWQNYPIQWNRADRGKAPPHWLRIRERESMVTSNRNRHAVDPMNAMLNYAYGVLEGQCRTALTSLGFDVARGILHTDKANRDSLVYDLMEPCRPQVDGLLLDVLRHTFRLGDFITTTDGACRLHPQLARYVVASCRLPDATVLDQARQLRNLLLSPADRTVPQPA